MEYIAALWIMVDSLQSGRFALSPNLVEGKTENKYRIAAGTTRCVSGPTWRRRGAACAPCAYAVRVRAVRVRLLQPERLPQLRLGHETRVDGRADIELASAGQRPDDQRREARILHELFRHLERLGIIARDRNRNRRALAVRFAAQITGVDRVEGPHQTHAGQILRRCDASALATRLERHRPIALRVRITRIEHDLAGELTLQVPSDLRQRSVRHRDQHDLTKLRGLARCTNMRP